VSVGVPNNSSTAPATRHTQVLRMCCFDAAALAAVMCAAGNAEPLTGPELRRVFRVVIQGSAGDWGSATASSSGSETRGGDEIGSGGDGKDMGGGLHPLDDAASEAVVAICLWEVLDSWPPELIAGFLRFVTGTER
jgi:hypothetical protein